MNIPADVELAFVVDPLVGLHAQIGVGAQQVDITAQDHVVAGGNGDTRAVHQGGQGTGQQEAVLAMAVERVIHAQAVEVSGIGPRGRAHAQADIPAGGDGAAHEELARPAQADVAVCAAQAGYCAAESGPGDDGAARLDAQERASVNADAAVGTFGDNLCAGGQREGCTRIDSQVRAVAKAFQGLVLWQRNGASLECGTVTEYSIPNGHAVGRAGVADNDAGPAVGQGGQVARTQVEGGGGINFYTR